MHWLIHQTALPRHAAGNGSLLRALGLALLGGDLLPGGAEIPQDAHDLTGGDRVLLDVGGHQPTEAVIVDAGELTGDLAAGLAVERAEQLDDDVLSTHQALVRGFGVLALDGGDARAG